MINFDLITDGNKKIRDPKWPKIYHYSYIILTIG